MAKPQRPKLQVVTNEKQVEKEIIHVSTQVTVTYGYVEDGNVISLPPVGFTINRALSDKKPMEEFVTAYEEQRAVKHAEVNGLLSEG